MHVFYVLIKGITCLVMTMLDRLSMKSRSIILVVGTYNFFLVAYISSVMPFSIVLILSAFTLFLLLRICGVNMDCFLELFMISSLSLTPNFFSEISY